MEELPKLHYSSDALELYYDKITLEIHHQKHHQSYVNGLNNALTKLKEARETGDFSLIKHWEKELAFHGAGHLLHSLFWENMQPGSKDNLPKGKIQKAIEQSFGSFENFKKQFSAATLAIECSGWGSLAKDEKQNLHILTIENHQKQHIPGYKPVLVCDVWEHSYYKKWGPQRAEYIKTFWQVVNWEKVEEYYLKVLK